MVYDFAIFSNRDLTKVIIFWFLPVTTYQGWILNGFSADKQTLDEGCGNLFLPLVSIRRAFWLAGLFFGSLRRLSGGIVVSYLEPNCDFLQHLNYMNIFTSHTL